MSLQRLQGGMLWDLLARTVINSAINSIDNAATWLSTLLAYETNAYVEGTFTPAMTFGGGSTGITYSTQTGFYTRIGRIVHIDIALVFTSKGSSTGTAVITGLPFTVAVNAPIAIFMNNVTAGVGDVVFFAPVQGAGTTIPIQQISAGTVATLDDTSFANNTVIRINGVYRLTP
jgi:predicted aconitase with swiveling domain